MKPEDIEAPKIADDTQVEEVDITPTDTDVNIKHFNPEALTGLERELHKKFWNNEGGEA
ncbi:hypothetical protein JW758_01000 [Candidatus Peregrinibacteria bacterium]|nr:hypothetical protein [Candidatus Peregrinibacteria bacterium]